MQLTFSKFTEISELMVSTQQQTKDLNKINQHASGTNYISIGKSSVGCLSEMLQYSQYVSISCSNFARLSSSLLADPPLLVRCFFGAGSSDFAARGLLRAGGDLVDALAEVVEEALEERTLMAVSESLGSLARFLYFRLRGGDCLGIASAAEAEASPAVRDESWVAC